MIEECPVCKGRVDLTKVEDYPDYKLRYYSCGHISKFVQRAIIEPAITVSDSVALSVTRFKHSPKVTIEEKTQDGRPSLQFSADNAKIVINNSIVTFNSPEGKTSQNISASIWEKIKSIFQEVKEDPSIVNKDELLSLLDKISSLEQQPERRVSLRDRLKYRDAGDRWVFSTATPYILKIIDIITETLKRSSG